MKHYWLIVLQKKKKNPDLEILLAVAHPLWRNELLAWIASRERAGGDKPSLV